VTGVASRSDVEDIEGLDSKRNKMDDEHCSRRTPYATNIVRVKR